MSKKSISYSESVNKDGIHTTFHTSSPGKCEQEGFAQRLKLARKQRNLEQKELGDAVGVSRTTIQNYEGGQFPKGEYLIALARVLDCSIDWLMTGEEEGAKTAPQKQGKNDRQQEERPAQRRNPQDNNESVADLIWKTSKILESNTSYAWALSANIHAFYQALSSEAKPDQAQMAQGQIMHRLEALERSIQNMQEGRVRPRAREGSKSDEAGDDSESGGEEGGSQEGPVWF